MPSANSVEKFEKNASVFKAVNIRQLNIDPNVQRRLDKAWVNARIDKFDVDLLGYVVVNQRPDGKQYIVDGQHRTALMRAVGWGDQNVSAEFFNGLTIAEEAALFRARNDRKALRKFDNFRIALVQGEPTATAINKIVASFGLAISDQLTPGSIAAVASLEKVYGGCGISPERGPKALAESLYTIIHAWGNQTSAVSGQVIHAVGLVHLRYGNKIDKEALVHKLASYSGGPSGLLGSGKNLREHHGKSLPHCIGRVIVDTYNKGRRGTKLESWDN